MRASVPTALVVALIATAPSVRLKAENGDALPSLRTSIATTAKAFASSQSATDTTAKAAWRRLTTLPKGARLVIRTQGRQIAHAAFVEADDVGLTGMIGVLRRSFARSEIVDVRLDRKGSRAGAYVGGFLGCLVGGAVGTGLSRRCHGNCTEGDPKIAGLSCAGMAAALGYAGYYGLRTPGEVIYVAP